MNYFEFDNGVKIISGENALDKLAQVVLGLGGRRVLLVSDANLQKLGMTVKIIKMLNKKEVTVGATYIEVPKVASVDTIKQLYKIYRSNGCDSIVACGGGSVIDIAKGLKLLLSTRSKNLLDCRGVNNIKNYIQVPFVTIPTNAGTGMDVCKITMIKDDKSSKLMEFETATQLPQYTILQPDLTLSVSEKYTAMGAIDILGHSIEAYCGRNSNPLVRSFCATALQLAFESIHVLIDDPKNLQAREKIMQAQALSAMSFGNSKSGIIHAFAYAMGELYSQPYSYAIAIVMKECLEFNYQANKDKYCKLAFYTLGEETFVQLNEEEKAKAFVDKISNVLNVLTTAYDIPSNLKQIGLNQDDIELLAQRAYNESSVVTNARAVETNDLQDILRKCLGDSVEVQANE